MESISAALVATVHAHADSRASSCIFVTALNAPKSLACSFLTTPTRSQASEACGLSATVVEVSRCRRRQTLRLGSISTTLSRCRSPRLGCGGDGAESADKDEEKKESWQGQETLSASKKRISGSSFVLYPYQFQIPPPLFPRCVFLYVFLLRIGPAIQRIPTRAVKIDPDHNHHNVCFLHHGYERPRALRPPNMSNLERTFVSKAYPTGDDHRKLLEHVHCHISYNINFFHRNLNYVDVSLIV